MMIKYKERLFSRQKNVLKSVGKYIKDHPLLPLSSVTATVSTANYITNKNRDKKDKIYQEKQLGAMEKLTSSLNRVTESVQGKPRVYYKEKKKSFSFKDDIVKGAVTGAGVGLTVSKLFKNKANDGSDKPKDSPKGLKGSILDVILSRPDFVISLIGAGLGAIVGSLSWITKKLSYSTSDKFLMNDIVRSLTNLGYKEDVDFTRSAKIADLMKTKVCLVFSRTHSEMKILINSNNDPSLNRLLEKTLKQELPTNFSSNRRKSGDRFNEITITSVSTEKEKDRDYLLGLIELFITSKYPVYIIEVG